MATLVAERLWTAQEYFHWERQQERKHELHKNRIYAMAGVSRWHNEINGNLVAFFFTRFREKQCRAYFNDLRLAVDWQSTYTYPDLVVVCGRPLFLPGVKPDTLTNPTLIFEILSPSTEYIDRNFKLESYLRLESLQGYFLVAQDAPQIEAYICADDGGWRQELVVGLEATLWLDMLGCAIPLAGIYAGLEFD